MLHKRSPQNYEKWRGYLFYFLNALKKFPDLETTVYRGIPGESFDLIQKEYKEKRPIFWSAFSSSTPAIEIAKGYFENQNFFYSNIPYSKEKMKFYSNPIPNFL